MVGKNQQANKGFYNQALVVKLKVRTNLERVEELFFIKRQDFVSQANFLKARLHH